VKAANDILGSGINVRGSFCVSLIQVACMLTKKSKSGTTPHPSRAGVRGGRRGGNAWQHGTREARREGDKVRYVLSEQGAVDVVGSQHETQAGEQDSTASRVCSRVAHIREQLWITRQVRADDY
jgi:hypothetical protein